MLSTLKQIRHIQTLSSFQNYYKRLLFFLNNRSCQNIVLCLYSTLHHGWSSKSDAATDSATQAPQPVVPQAQQRQAAPAINPVNQLVNNVPIAQTQVIQGADGGLTLKVQQTE